MAARKMKTTEYCVADAIDNAKGELESLRDELQDRYDNMPESLQGGDVGDTLQNSVESLDVDNCDVCSAIEDSAEDDDATTKGNIGGLRFSYTESARKKSGSRRERRDDATALLQCAIDAITEELDAKDGDENDPYIETRDDIQSSLDSLTELVDNANDAEFPGMYGK